MLSEEISAKERIVEETEIEIDAARGAYQPVATHASVLFFCVSDLAVVESMYQFSLEWFIALYLQVCFLINLFIFFFFHSYLHATTPVVSIVQVLCRDPQLASCLALILFFINYHCCQCNVQGYTVCLCMPHYSSLFVWPLSWWWVTLEPRGCFVSLNVL